MGPDSVSRRGGSAYRAFRFRGVKGKRAQSASSRISKKQFFSSLGGIVETVGRESRME